MTYRMEMYCRNIGIWASLLVFHSWFIEPHSVYWHKSKLLLCIATRFRYFTHTCIHTYIHTCMLVYTCHNYCSTFLTNVQMKWNAGVLGHFFHYEGWIELGIAWANEVNSLWNLPGSSIDCSTLTLSPVRDSTSSARNILHTRSSLLSE